MTLLASPITFSEYRSSLVNTQWYVAHCQPLKERYAAQNLSQWLGLTVFLPEVRRYFRGVVEEVPLFPRYLFLKADLGVTAISRINTTAGVSRLLAFDDAPLPVPGEVVRALYERVAALNREGGIAEHGFTSGEVVEIIGGPLCGLDAIFLGPLEPSERVRVLIEFLGQMQNIEVGVGEIARLAGDHVANVDELAGGRGPRRTRGGGRKIHNGL